MASVTGFDSSHFAFAKKTNVKLRRLVYGCRSMCTGVRVFCTKADSGSQSNGLQCTRIGRGKNELLGGLKL